MADYNSAFTGKQIDERLAKVPGLEQSVGELSTQKVNVDQGAENADKFLGIGKDGKIVPTEAPSGGVSSWNDLTDKPDAFPPTAHTQAASTITAGTFAGQVVANSSGQAAASYVVRNSKLASAEESPTVNGQICWKYE